MLGVERVDFEMTDALRASGLTLVDGTGPFLFASIRMLLATDDMGGFFSDVLGRLE